jgi:serine/threonine protein kinase
MAPDHGSETRRLGDFEVVREIGRGGMGVVYEARQVSLNRKVALKVLSGGLGLTPKAVQRFRREAEAAASLHHTNIVPVYANGEQDGTHFYAMELIEGPSLDHVIRQMRQTKQSATPSSEPGRLNAGSALSAASHRGADASPPANLEATGPYVGQSSATQALTTSSLSSDSYYFDRVARMIAEVADALEYAHQQGVIHRDMKPSNLLLSPAGRLSINDFGLARMLEQPGMTMTGEFVGTPAYMSPEQITAGRTPLDHRTDIYSFGATMYELLTLHPPFSGERRDQVLAQILHKEPKAPRRLERRVPVDLETICLKCLEKDPDRRYQTAGALAEDLRRYANRFAISARRAGPVQRLVKWVKRRPAVAASLGCLVLAVGGALALAYWVHHEKQQRRIEQERTEERLREQEERDRAKLLDEKISKAYMVAAGGDLNKTEEVIKEIEKLGGSTGQVRLFRGMVIYFRGDYPSAIKQLEQAVDLMPESVAARALLATSYILNGQQELGWQVRREMERLTPSTPEDYLFKGDAQGMEGLANLNEALRRRPDSPLAHALLAAQLANWAFDTRNLAEVEDALREIEAARILAPEHPKILNVSILSRVIAAVIYQETNQPPEKRAAVLKDAQRDVRKLEPSLDDLPTAFYPVYFFYVQTGERRKALEVARQSLARSRNSSAAISCALQHYHLGQFDQALECLDQRLEKDLMGDVLRAFVLAEKKPDGPRLALEEYEGKPRDLPEDSMRSWTNVLLLLGEKDRALVILQEPDHKSFTEADAPFFRGELSEEEYFAKVGPSRMIQSAAHLQVGLWRLAAGDRTGARKHFLEGARPCWGYENFWCDLFLSRMDSDPEWPTWIALKKQ